MNVPHCKLLFIMLYLYFGTHVLDTATNHYSLKLKNSLSFLGLFISKPWLMSPTTQDTISSQFHTTCAPLKQLNITNPLHRIRVSNIVVCTAFVEQWIMS